MPYAFPSLAAYSDLALLALRLVIAGTFLAHGLMKRGTWKAQPSEQMPSGMLRLMRLLSVCEPLGAVAMALGLLAQPAAVGLGLVMGGAIWLKATKWHVPYASSSVNGWEFDLMTLAACLTVLALGAGAWSVDAALLAR
jgi:putative oxidoreductase